jgi:hypothetical protein
MYVDQEGSEFGHTGEGVRCKQRGDVMQASMCDGAGHDVCIFTSD